MLHSTFKHALARLMLVAFCLTGPVLTAMAGLDSYEIYLNDKLILQQYVNQPLDVRSLQLKNAKAGDRLVIYYRHCTLKGAGSGRSITLQDEKGKVMKKWHFEDSPGSNTSMVIPVAELLKLQKDRTNLSLHYQAAELPAGEMLASLRLKEA